MVNEKWKLQKGKVAVGVISICSFHSPVINNHFDSPASHAEKDLAAERRKPSGEFITQTHRRARALPLQTATRVGGFTTCTSAA